MAVGGEFRIKKNVLGREVGRERPFFNWKEFSVTRIECVAPALLLEGLSLRRWRFFSFAIFLTYFA